jgi:excisionase family DNA binding protein
MTADARRESSFTMLIFKEFFMEERTLLTFEEAAHRLSVSRTTLYALVERGAFPVIRIGTAVRIPSSAIQEWVEKQLAGSDTEA